MGGTHLADKVITGVQADIGGQLRKAGAAVIGHILGVVGPLVVFLFFLVIFVKIEVTGVRNAVMQQVKQLFDGLHRLGVFQNAAVHFQVAFVAGIRLRGSHGVGKVRAILQHDADGDAVAAGTGICHKISTKFHTKLLIVKSQMRSNASLPSVYVTL